jgi:hypothetical protein
MTIAVFKKIFLIIQICCFCFVVNIVLPQNAYSASKKQIMRNLGITPRSIEKKRRSKQKFDRNIVTPHSGFRIHKDFKCPSTSLNNLNISAISEASFINREILYDADTFALTIQIINAHLNIALKSYAINGIDLDIQKYAVRFHSDDELIAYPEDIALEPQEPMKIFFPDTLRSAAYINYVILPLLQEFISPDDYRLLKKMMSIITFIDVLKNEKKRKIWHYHDYEKYITATRKFLDHIERNFFKDLKTPRQSVLFQEKIMRTLLTNNWISFLALRSCGFITYPNEPAYDANLYYEATVARDNYLMGLGIFEQFKQKTQEYAIHNKAPDNDTHRAIQRYIQFFNHFYGTIEPPETDSLPFVDIRRLHIDAVCSLRTEPLDRCRKIVDIELRDIEN